MRPLAVNLAAVVVQFAVKLLALTGSEAASVGATLSVRLRLNTTVFAPQLTGLVAVQLAVGPAGGNTVALIFNALINRLGLASESQGESAGKRQQELLHDRR
ncbi:hypothetical protein A0257_02850 [Hymenobacter psoromatis]|nr:hypothetical protein A0257_02850 [Hymenobacter psoromatis]